MLRYLPFLLELIMLVYCLVDCAQTDESRVRNLPKLAWIVLIIIFPIVGGIAWLVAGRPVRTGRAVPWPSTGTAGYPEYQRPRPVAPDDDPQFLAQLNKANTEHERLLKTWEEDLKRREEQLRGSDPGQPAQPPRADQTDQSNHPTPPSDPPNPPAGQSDSR